MQSLYELSTAFILWSRYRLVSAMAQNNWDRCNRLLGAQNRHSPLGQKRWCLRDWHEDPNAFDRRLCSPRRLEADKARVMQLRSWTRIHAQRQNFKSKSGIPSPVKHSYLLLCPPTSKNLKTISFVMLEQIITITANFLNSTCECNASFIYLSLGRVCFYIDLIYCIVYPPSPSPLNAQRAPLLGRLIYYYY